MTNALLPIATLNEPAGFKTLSFHAFDTVEGDGWLTAYGDKYLSASGGILTATWWKGLGAGKGPYNLQLKHTPVSSCYTVFRFSAPVKPPNPLLKLGFFQSTSGGHPVLMLKPGLQVHMEGGPLKSAFFCQNGPNLLSGATHTAEVLWQPKGSGMVLTQWLNGKQIGPVTTQAFGKITGFWINPNCAGGTRAWPSNQDMKLEYWYTSGM